MKQPYLFLIALLKLFTPEPGFAQDSLLQIDLAPYVYHFNLEQDQLTGEGADFLKMEAIKNQYFLFGEYHGSPRISALTQAMIPILSDAGYQHMALEVGPASVDFLKAFSKDPTKSVARLHDFNQQYKFIEADGYVNMPIPFFDYIEDAEFLQEASRQNWQLLGLDQEYYYCYLPLLDRMFDNLNSRDQEQLQTLHQAAKDSIFSFYKLDETDQQSLMVSIKASETVQSFLEKASEANNKNKAIAEAIEMTTQIYGYNNSRKYYACNSTRIDYMKTNLKKQFDALDFDLKEDKLFLKMGGIHTARGFSWLSLHEIGNTLSELADFHGNQSIHFNFQNRYYLEDGVEKDELEDTESYAYRFVDFLQFAKKDQWTIIDLRPLREKVFYHRKYKLEPAVLDFFKQHDVIIIPKMEVEGTPNY